jgi:hypothetical protein
MSQSCSAAALQLRCASEFGDAEFRLRFFMAFAGI